jgi:hypothetical protein
MTVQGSPTPTASTSCRPSSAVTGRSDEATLPATGRRRRRRRRRVSWPGRNEVERPRPLAAILDFFFRSKCGSQAIFIRVWVLSYRPRDTSNPWDRMSLTRGVRPTCTWVKNVWLAHVRTPRSVHVNFINFCFGYKQQCNEQLRPVGYCTDQQQYFRNRIIHYMFEYTKFVKGCLSVYC